LLSVCLPPKTSWGTGADGSSLPEVIRPTTYTSLVPPEHGEGNVGGGSHGSSLDRETEEERHQAALEFLLTLIETADYKELKDILELDKGAMGKMILGRMWLALIRDIDGEGGEQGKGSEREDLEAWLRADDVSEVLPLTAP
jgi:hypothetical protein